ncbi:hypothetical protein E4T49_00874 [Aureobasidium sp. EXF-10728]|nr:hypothetical protein E4T49_00874 [Aureobasidium sp. EXF-10728]
MNEHHKEVVVMPQTHSPLFRLPGELRNWIYDLALTPSTLSLAQASHVRHITINLREAASRNTAPQSEQSRTVANEWTHYLCCTQGAHMLGAWCANLSTLKSDIPYLRSLCLDLTNWQPDHAGSRVGGWRYLQILLRNIRDLDSFTLKGKCLDSGFWSSQPVPWSLGLWISPAFDKDESALVDMMGQTVRMAGEKEVRLIDWHTKDGVTTLTVRVVEARNACSPNGGELHLSRNGRMSWDSFLEFQDDQVELTRKRKASLPASGATWNGVPAIQA